jgi:hypothetical protein
MKKIWLSEAVRDRFRGALSGTSEGKGWPQKCAKGREK